MQYVAGVIAAIAILYILWRVLSFIVGYAILGLVAGVDWLGSGIGDIFGLGKMPAFNWAVVLGLAAASVMVVRQFRKQARPFVGLAFPLVASCLLVGLSWGVSDRGGRSASTSEHAATPPQPPSVPTPSTQPQPTQQVPSQQTPSTQCALARDPARGAPLTMAGKSIDKKSSRPADTANFEAAVEFAQTAVNVDPTCAEAYSTLAYARYRSNYGACGAKGNYGPAESAAQRALELAKDGRIRASALRNLGRIAAAKHRWDDALDLFRKSVESDGTNSDSELWIADLETFKSMSAEMLSNLVRVLKGERLEVSNLTNMTLREGTWLLNAVLVRGGRQLNVAVEDWFFYCPDSPLARELTVMPAIDVNAGRTPVKQGTVDWENTQLIVAKRKALKAGGQVGAPAGADPFESDTRSPKPSERQTEGQVGEHAGADPFEFQKGAVKPRDEQGDGVLPLGGSASATSVVPPSGVQGAWIGSLEGGGQLKLNVEDVSGRIVRGTVTAMANGDFETLKVSGTLVGNMLVLDAPNGAKLSARLKFGTGMASLSGSWQSGDGSKLTWTGRKL